MEKNAKIYVAGSGTFIGSSIVRELRRRGYEPIIEEPGKGPELTDASEVNAFFSRFAPDYVFMAAGEIAGIGANQRYPADLMLNNLLVECHVIHSAYAQGVKKLLYLASSCSYPKLCPQPMRVESLMAGPLEPTSEFYALAKIAGIKLCQAYRKQHGANFVVGIPANPFGPGDDFTLEDAHVIGALIRKMHDAKRDNAESIEIWGTGAPQRDFIFVDDLANACAFIMDEYDEAEPINIGSGSNTSIRDLAELIKEVVGYKGRVGFDTSKPDGMPFKLLDSGKLNQLGWQPRTPLLSALAATYDSFLENSGNGADSFGAPRSSPGKGASHVR